MKDIIQHRLDNHYAASSPEDELNALKEITQEVVLYALQKAGLFEEASFLGGTCLRIVHSLDRFSEDLDFSTRAVNPKFDLDSYLGKALEVMRPYGYDLTVDEKDLRDKNVRSRFLKDDSIKKVLTFKHHQDQRQKIKIKVEVDTCPPAGALAKTEYVDFPDDFQILAYDVPSLMAGKIHALLCRPFSKGRDWYDFSWYVKNNHAPNLEFLGNALKQLGPWQGRDIQLNDEFLKDVLFERIRALDWQDVKLDVRKFLGPEKASSLDLWSADFFESKVKKLRIPH